jgi:uncharacterized protein (DUF1697 family)
MPAQIALLRSINLGPARRVAMGELRALLDAAGYGPVRTYVQSGNVVLRGETTETELEALLAERFGFEIPVILRSRAELEQVIARDPIGALVTEPRRYQVTFLRADAPADLEQRARAVALPGERVVVIGREVYAWHPEGVARSKLALLLADRKIGGTARNWITLLALVAMSP